MGDELRDTLGPVAEQWIESRLIHAEGDRFGEPFRLLPWQRRFLWRWYELHPDRPGEWWHNEAIIGRVRGDVKSEFLAALAMLEFAGPPPFRRSSPIIHLAAAALKQAGEVFSQAQVMAGGQGGAVPDAPLAGLFDVWDTEIVYADGRPGKLERVAADAGTLEGTKTTLFLADEVGEWHGRVARVYSTLTAALGKRVNARRIAIGVAGVGRGSIPPGPRDSLWWREYVRGLTSLDDPTSRLLFEWAAAPADVRLDSPAELRDALRQAGGGEADGTADVVWSVEDRARMYETGQLTEPDLRRYFLNQWHDATGSSWLDATPGAWEACTDPAAAVIPDRAPVLVGVDMALHADSVGVTVVHRLDDGRTVWQARIFAADAGRIDHVAVMAHLHDLADRYRVDGVVYDPRFFELPATMLEDEGYRAVRFPQSPERMVPACRHAHQLIVAGQVVHDGDPALASHVRNAQWRDGERGRTLSKARSDGKIDALIAAVIATAELDEPDDPEPDPLGLVY